jgi:hypothetical protein
MAKSNNKHANIRKTRRQTTYMRIFGHLEFSKRQPQKRRAFGATAAFWHFGRNMHAWANPTDPICPEPICPTNWTAHPHMFCQSDLRSKQLLEETARASYASSNCNLHDFTGAVRRHMRITYILKIIFRHRVLRSQRLKKLTELTGTTELEIDTRALRSSSRSIQERFEAARSSFDAASVQDAPRRLQDAPRCLQDAPRRPKMAQRCLQDASKTRKAPKSAQNLKNKRNVDSMQQTHIRTA